MRDRITINELNDDLKNKINRIPNENIVISYSKSEIDNKINELRELISQNMGSLPGNSADLSNYYTKTETDVKITQSINASILEHNGDTKAHNDIRNTLSNITDMISNFRIETQVFNLSVIADGQTVFNIDDTNYIPAENPTSIVIWNSTILTNYTITGRSVTFSDGIPSGSTLNLVIFSLKGAV